MSFSTPSLPGPVRHLFRLAGPRFYRFARRQPARPGDVPTRVERRRSGYRLCPSRYPAAGWKRALAFVLEALERWELAVPKRRDLIRMTEPEMWDFIEGQKSVQVATLNRDGSPHLTTLWFAVVDRKLVFETFTKSQKVVNLRRDPRIALLLESGEVYEELRGVSINATAELLTDFDDVHAMHMAVLRRNTPEIPEETLEKVSRGMAAKKTAIVVVPEKVMTWDHTKLDGIY